MLNTSGATTFAFMLITFFGTPVLAMSAMHFDPSSADMEPILLPEPRTDGGLAVEQALLRRRSVREYQPGALSLAEISQLMWAAQGVTSPQGLRSAPSAGALYPLEVYVVIGNVSDLADGVYQYIPSRHELEALAKGDKRAALARAAWGQRFIKEGAALVVISAIYERTTKKYGQRGIRYVHMEAGHAAQNVFLQASSLGLATVVVGAFDDNAVRDILGLSAEEHPLYLMPLGRGRR